MPKKPSRIEEWEKDFDSLWGVSFDGDGEKEPFEFERLKDFVSQLLETAKKEAYDSIEKRYQSFGEKQIRKEAQKSILTSVMKEMNLELKQGDVCTPDELVKIIHKDREIIQKKLEEL